MVKSGSHSISYFRPEGSISCRCSSTQRMNKEWKRRDCWQQRARQERLNYSRNWRVDDHHDDMIMKMGEENDPYKSTLLDGVRSEIYLCDENEKLMDCPAAADGSHSVNVDSASSREVPLTSFGCDDSGKNRLTDVSYDVDNSCLTDPTSLNKENDYDNESVSSYHVPSRNELALPDGNSSSDSVKSIVKSKRHCDRDLDNPKPSKFRRPDNDSSSLSHKYSTESFCGIDDHLPDGFYDAGRDRPFMSLEEYDQSLGLDSREVILLDR